MSVFDYFCSCPGGGGEPSLDTDVGGENNILSFAGSQFIDTDGNYITNFQFSKPLSTGDTKDNILAIGQENTYFNFFCFFPKFLFLLIIFPLRRFLFAVGSSNTFGYHASAIGVPGIAIGTTVAPPKTKDYTQYK